MTDTTAHGGYENMNRPPLQSVPVIRCPECRTRDVRYNGLRANVRYYKCNACPATFKVMQADPLNPNGGK